MFVLIIKKIKVKNLIENSNDNVDIIHVRI